MPVNLIVLTMTVYIKFAMILSLVNGVKFCVHFLICVLIFLLFAQLMIRAGSVLLFYHLLECVPRLIGTTSMLVVSTMIVSIIYAWTQSLHVLPVRRSAPQVSNVLIFFLVVKFGMNAVTV